jgi:hypothetical protein
MILIQLKHMIYLPDLNIETVARYFQNFYYQH